MSRDHTIRVALARDYPQERWASMDLYAEMVQSHLAGRPSIQTEDIVPAWQGRGLPGPRLNLERVLNRMWRYPKHIHKLSESGQFDILHVIDHSYSQLILAAPPGRGVVTCHDLDTFRCLLEPHAEPRPPWFRALARRSLAGLKRAAAVACVSAATRDTILAHNLLPAHKLRVIPNGVPPEFFTPTSPQDEHDVDAVLGPNDPQTPMFLHVGSVIPRKRIDVLLNVFARIKQAMPTARLAKIGGRFTPEQQALAEQLGVVDSITFFPYIEPNRRGVIAAAYRRADLVLMTSESEGFGLPVAEALACGAMVLASDLPVVREVGGDAAHYQTVADINAWTQAAITLVRSARENPLAFEEHRRTRRARGARFSWDAHASQLIEMYQDVMTQADPASSPKV